MIFSAQENNQGKAFKLRLSRRGHVVCCLLLLLVVVGCFSNEAEQAVVPMTVANVQQKQPLITAKDLPGVWGRYIAGASPDKGLHSSLTFGTWQGNKVAFTLDLGSAACVGLVEGQAQLINDGLLHFVEQNEQERVVCELYFHLGAGEVRVEEVDCSYYHGAQCDFSGKFAAKNLELR